MIHILKSLIPGFLFPILLNPINVNSQVSFTQTTDGDFNKGVLNSVVVSNNNVSLQNSASNTGLWWTGTSFLPQNLTGHKTVTANNKYVYLVGGYNGSTYSNNVYLATIQSSGISTWTELNPLPVALRDPAVLVGTNTIYVIGGRNGTQIFDAIYYLSSSYEKGYVPEDTNGDGLIDSGDMININRNSALFSRKMAPE